MHYYAYQLGFCLGGFVRWFPYYGFHFGLELWSYLRITSLCLIMVGWVLLPCRSFGRVVFHSGFRSNYLPVFLLRGLAGWMVFGRLCPLWWYLRTAKWYRKCYGIHFMEYDLLSCFIVLGPAGHTSRFCLAEFRLNVFRVNPIAW